MLRQDQYSRYEFLFRTSRVSFWLGLCGAFYTLLLGAIVAGLVVGDAFREQPWLHVREALAILTLGLALALLSLSVLRRTLLQAYDCRVGEAGIYFRSLARQQVFVEWPSFAGFELTRHTARLSFEAEGRRRTVWLALPSGAATSELRLRNFLDGKLRARAASVYARAEPAPPAPLAAPTSA